MSLPCVDLTNSINPQFGLWYHAYGADMGRLHIDLFDGVQIIRDIVAPIVGNQGDEWKELTVDLTPWSGQVIGLRIRGYTGSGEKGDLAIDDISITDVVSVSDISDENSQLQVYPNPGDGIFNISLDNLTSDNHNLTVTDITGRVVYTEKLKVADRQLRKTIDLSHLSKGAYVLEITGEQQSVSTKLQIR